MPQYLPIQPNIAPRNDQPAPNMFSQYGQFPSTYPYNTLNPQYFNQSNLSQNIQSNISSPPVTVNPSAGIYAPIPFVGQSLHPGMQTVMTYPSNSPPFPPQQLHNSQISVEIDSGSINREGVYIDDTRNVKRPKVEIKRTLPLPILRVADFFFILAAPKEVAPKPVAPKVCLSLEVVG